MTLFDLVLRTSASLHPDGEPDDFVTEFTGLIRCEDDAGTVKRVDKVHSYRSELTWRSGLARPEGGEGRPAESGAGPEGCRPVREPL
jgi:hypothetical protein